MSNNMQHVKSENQSNGFISQQANNSNTANPVQVQNYIHWINTHLKKRPAVKLVENLQTDLSNGVCLVHLIEVISGSFLADVNFNPRTHQDCVENIEKILKFMQKNAIKMHQITPNEIIEGNLKSIMRLVLALAAHFKPSNVQPYSETMCQKMKQQQQLQNHQFNVLSTTARNKFEQPKCHEAPPATAHSQQHQQSQHLQPSSNLGAYKRSQSSNNAHTFVNRRQVMAAILNQHQPDQFNRIDRIETLNNGPVESTLNTSPLPPSAPVFNHNQSYERQNNQKCRNLDSMTHLVQAACVNLADVRKYKNENFNIKYVRRNNLSNGYAASTASSSNVNYLNPIDFNSQRQAEGASSNSNQICTKDQVQREKNASKPHPFFISDKDCDVLSSNLEESNNARNQIKTSNQIEEIRPSKTDESRSLKSQPFSLQKLQIETNQEFNIENVEISLDELKSLKSTLISLQSIVGNFNSEYQKLNEDTKISYANTLVRAEPINPVDCSFNSAVETTKSSKERENEESRLTLEEQVNMYRAKLSQLELLNADLKRELNKTRCEHVNSTNPTEYIQLNNEQMENERREFLEKLSAMAGQMEIYKNDLTQKDALIQRLKDEIDELRKENKHARLVKEQVKRVSNTLEMVQKKENALTSMLTDTDRKLDFIGNKLSQRHQKKEMIASLLTEPSLSSMSLNEIHEQLKDNLKKLKANSNLEQSAQVQIALIESNISFLLDKVMNTNHHMSESASPSSLTSSSSSSSPPSANSPVSSSALDAACQQQQQPMPQIAAALETSPSSFSIHSSSSSSSASSISPPPCNLLSSDRNTKSLIKVEQSSSSALDEVNESKIKKIISRLLSQNYANKNECNLENNFTQKTDAKPTALLAVSSSSSSSSTSSSSNILNQQHDFTQCFYYLDNNTKPNVVTIFKNINEITLRDFKECVKLNSDSYKYRFKSLDPEFGFLKEEISADNKILPKCEGKVVAWIESC